MSISRLNNPNIAHQTKGPIASVRFHPNGNVLLTGGKDNKINLFQIANNKSEVIKTIEFEGLPITQAEFVQQGREIVCVGRQKIFYTFDLERMKIEQHFGIRGIEAKSFYKIFPSPKGTYIAVIPYAVNGECILISGRTKQYLTCFKVNSSLYAVAFSPCENFLYLTGGDRSIFVFEIRSQSCINSFSDNGGLKCTALGVSPDGTRLACGSESGIVNLYECSNGDASQLKLIKSLENLTTWIENIRFNSTSELMGISGNQKDNHFRILHLGTIGVIITVICRWVIIAEKQCYLNFLTTIKRLNKTLNFSILEFHIASNQEHIQVHLYKEAYQNWNDSVPFRQDQIQIYCTMHPLTLMQQFFVQSHQQAPTLTRE